MHAQRAVDVKSEISHFDSIICVLAKI